uniref:Uncharacterized protein n=1 Tax=Caenorhabditis japonica TaxID=281687 RepID=A0A8R1IM05_CAEJA
MTVLQTENERLQERIRKCESEKLAAEKRLRKAQRAFEAEKRTAEGLKANLQHAAEALAKSQRIADRLEKIIATITDTGAKSSPADSPLACPKATSSPPHAAYPLITHTILLSFQIAEP